MPVYLQVFLLFTMNFIDGLLTIFWVRNGFATEGNHLMATLLDIGDLPFLLVKIAMGAVAAVVLWHWGHMRLARYGLLITLVLYTCVMCIHLLTGLSAFGMVTKNSIIDISGWTFGILGFLV